MFKNYPDEIPLQLEEGATAKVEKINTKYEDCDGNDMLIEQNTQDNTDTYDTNDVTDLAAGTKTNENAMTTEQKTEQTTDQNETNDLATDIRRQMVITVLTNKVILLVRK